MENFERLECLGLDPLEVCSSCASKKDSKAKPKASEKDDNFTCACDEPSTQECDGCGEWFCEDCVSKCVECEALACDDCEEACVCEQEIC